jgi:hypothetical protein
MDTSSFKVYAINLSAMTISTIDQIEVALKLLLLVVSIGYTVAKWHELRKKKN